MANIIKIKRSAVTATPVSLAEGELAYSENSGNLFIGTNGGVDLKKIGGNTDVLKLDGIAAGAQVNTVNSVNSQTGAVVLGFADVGAEQADATILKDADIGVTVQAYDATYLVDADIGVNVEAYDATILRTADKGVANGLATLGADSKIPTSQLPAIAISSTFVVASEVAQLALTVQEGDVAVRTDLEQTYIALNATNATMADWQVLSSPTDAVTSVNSQTGVVVLGFADVGAEQADATILKDADIGVNVQAYDATILVDADIGVNVEAFVTKNTAWNKSFGTTAGTVAEGNHNHDSAYMAIGVTIDGGSF